MKYRKDIISLGLAAVIYTMLAIMVYAVSGMARAIAYAVFASAIWISLLIFVITLNKSSKTNESDNNNRT